MLTRTAGRPSPAVTALNTGCACVTLDRAAMHQAMARSAGDPRFAALLGEARAHLVSNVAAFLSRRDADAMGAVVRAIEAATRLPRYQEHVLGGAAAGPDFGPAGVFMGYDFHITPQGPRLIEINTNAGGAFLGAFIRRAQRACCPEIEAALPDREAAAFDDDVVAMFEREWRFQRGPGRPRRIAIVDDNPPGQYLHPEFILAERLFRSRGLEALIADAGALSFDGTRLTAHGLEIDLVYNRLVDFDLSAPGHAALRAAYLAGAAVVTPNPRHHALFADKRNLVALSDQDRMRAFGLASEHLGALEGAPRAVEVTAANAAALWAERKRWFFKPAKGYGAKAVYRGDKLTRSTWDEIVRGGYIAQETAAPGERRVDVGGTTKLLKMDVRLFTYEGRVLLPAARLYQGQTTNFRTPGGGFAPVFIV